MTKLCEVLRTQLVSICLAMSAVLVGCQPNIEIPVWLDDSSGVVVGEEFLEIRNGKVKVTKAASRSKPEFATKKAHPTTGQMASLQVQVDQTTLSTTLPILYFNGKAEVWVHISRLTTPAIAEVQESLSFNWEGKPDCPLDQRVTESPTRDLYWAPDGGHLVLSLGARTVVFNVKDRKWLQLADVIVLPYFEQLYGVSPCRPDNAGFLAWRNKPVHLETPIVRGTQLEYPEKTFWDTASPVFVSWTGVVQEIAVPDNVHEADWLIGTEWRFPGQCQWDEHQLQFILANESLTIDTAKREVTFQVTGEPAKPHPKRDEVIDNVVLNGGRAEVQLVLTKDYDEIINGIPTATGWEGLCVRLQVLDLATGDARPIDRGAWSQFRLTPSPDRNFVLVSNDGQHAKPGPSILLDADGQIVHLFNYHASYVNAPDAWYWEAAERLYGVPALLHSPAPEYGLKFGMGRLSDDYESRLVSDATLEYMATVTGPMARVRELQGLTISGGRGLLTRDGLRHLRAFPRLRYLAISGMTIRDSDLRHFKELRELESLIFAESVCSNAALDALRQQLPNTEIRCN